MAKDGAAEGGCRDLKGSPLAGTRVEDLWGELPYAPRRILSSGSPNPRFFAQIRGPLKGVLPARRPYANHLLPVRLGEDGFLPPESLLLGFLFMRSAPKPSERIERRASNSCMVTGVWSCPTHDNA